MRSHIPEKVRQRVREAACHRCGYGLSPQHLVMARLEIEHLVPLSIGGTNEERNLWLACPICNEAKSGQGKKRRKALAEVAHREQWGQPFT